MLVNIKSRENPNVKILSKLISSKKARNEHGLFVIEGLRGCADAVKEDVRGNISVKSLFCEEKAFDNLKNALSGEENETLLNMEIFIVTRDIINRISHEENSQGIFTVAKKLHKNLDDTCLKTDGKYVVLDHLQDPGNVGTLLRTADAVGASGVVLTNNCCDIYNPKVVRATMGSMARINIFIENDFQKVCGVFSKLGIKTAAAVVSDGEEIRAFDFSGGVAVVLGNEGNGLEKNHIELCDKKVTISMKGNIESLNAAVAGAIIMWEMFRKQVNEDE